jgi:small subunit ribosomal protein S1
MFKEEAKAPKKAASAPAKKKEEATELPAQAEKSTFGDIDALAELKEKMEGKK